MDTKTILFTRDTDPEREGAAFKAGESHTLVVTSAERWLRRNAAVVVPAKAAPKAAEQEPAEPKAPEAPKAPASSGGKK